MRRCTYASKPAGAGAGVAGTCDSAGCGCRGSEERISIVPIWTVTDCSEPDSRVRSGVEVERGKGSMVVGARCVLICCCSVGEGNSGSMITRAFATEDSTSFFTNASIASLATVLFVSGRLDGRGGSISALSD